MATRTSPTEATALTAPPVSFVAVLHQMTPEERFAAYRSGAFTPHERSVWAANYAEEVPMVNDEFEWIALTLADMD